MAITAGIPVLIVALAMPLVLEGDLTGFVFAPLALLVVIACAARGPILGAGVAVLAILAVGFVASIAGVPMLALAVAATAVMGAAWFAAALSRGPAPMWAAVPGLILVVLVMFTGLSETLEGRLVVMFAVIALGLLAFLAGSWSVDGGVRVSRKGEAAALVLLLVFGALAVGVSSGLSGRLGEPVRLGLLGIDDPITPADGSPPDPFIYAARWQLEPTESERELFTTVVGPLAPQNRPIWASFNRYNGFGWYSAVTIGVPGDAVEPSDVPPGSRTDGRTRIDVGFALPGEWVPAPQQVSQILGSVPTRVDLDNGLVTAVSSPVDQTFNVTYEVAVATDEQLLAATPVVSDDLDPAVLLPGALPVGLQEIADAISAEAGESSWSRLVDLSRFLRSDRFTAAPPTVLASGTPDRSYAGLVDVIASGEGLQEQYAAIWALIGRSWGIPTRLVIGWLPEDAAGRDDSAVDTAVVRGADTGVWAQANLTGVGWVTFQPSPQDRDAGRPAVQRPLTPDDVPDRSSDTDTDSDVAPAPQPDDGTADDANDAANAESSSSVSAWVAIGAVALLLAGIGWLAFVRLSRRRLTQRVREADGRDAAAAAVAWVRALMAEAHIPLSVAWAPAEVPIDTPDLPDEVSAALRSFAVSAAPLRFTDQDVSASEVQALWRDVDLVDTRIIEATGARVRWRRRWRPLHLNHPDSRNRSVTGPTVRS